MKKILFLIIFLPIMLNAQIVYSPCDLHTNCYYYISDSIVFEQPTQLLFFDNDSLWQIGTPGKTIFNQAWSPNFAIMTDTINPYPDSSNTSFWFKIKPYEFGDLFIAFNHMADVGQGDSCIIEMSLDGLEWLTLIDLFENPSIRLLSMYSYSTDLQTLNTQSNFTPETPKNLYFTDTTFGWTQTIIWIDWFLMVKENSNNRFTDSLFIRFRFTSGINSFNNEGWIIDNIYLGSFNYNKPDNISDFKNKSFIKIFPNPADNFIEWDLNELEFPINITISNLNGVVIQSEIVNSKQVNVSKIPNGYYLLKFIDNSGKIFHSKLLISR